MKGLYEFKRVKVKLILPLSKGVKKKKKKKKTTPQDTVMFSLVSVYLLYIVLLLMLQQQWEICFLMLCSHSKS